MRAFSVVRRRAPARSRALLGLGSYAHYDLAGSLWEWVLDAFGPFDGEPCEDCAVIDVDANGVFRGGSWSGTPGNLRAAQRPGSFDRSRRYDYVGVRCAREP